MASVWSLERWKGGFNLNGTEYLQIYEGELLWKWRYCLSFELVFYGDVWALCISSIIHHWVAMLFENKSLLNFMLF